MRHSKPILLLAMLGLAACSVPDNTPEHRNVRLVAEVGEEGYAETKSEERYPDFDDWRWDVRNQPPEIAFEIDRVTRKKRYVVVEYWMRVKEWAAPRVYRFQAKVTLSYLLSPEEDVELQFAVRVRDSGAWKALKVTQEIPVEEATVPVSIDTGG
jgi:hypothetical protein